MSAGPTPQRDGIKISITVKNGSGEWARIDDLGYEPPSEQHEHGRDICLACTNQHDDIESIVPARRWVAQY